MIQRPNQSPDLGFRHFSVTPKRVRTKFHESVRLRQVTPIGNRLYRQECPVVVRGESICIQCLCGLKRGCGV